MNPNDCQFVSLKGIAEGNASTPPQSFVRQLKFIIRRRLSPSQERVIRRHANNVINRIDKLKGTVTPSDKPIKNIQTVSLKSGDMVRVRSKEEIKATLDHFGQTRGCSFMSVMATYCGTTQRVLKPMERFVDERDLRVKKCKGIILLEGVMCEGTTEFGRCDRSCFMFWREEWLEKIN